MFSPITLRCCYVVYGILIKLRQLRCGLISCANVMYGAFRYGSCGVVFSANVRRGVLCHGSYGVVVSVMFDSGGVD